MRRSESSRYIIVIEFEIITSEKYILTVLILTKPNQQPHLTIISPQARCCSVTLSGMRRTEPNPRKRVVRWGEVRWGDMMEERGGEGRSVSPGVFMSGWSVSVSAWQVPTGPHWSPGYKHSNCWALSCPEISTPCILCSPISPVQPVQPVFPAYQQMLSSASHKQTTNQCQWTGARSYVF